MTRRAASTEPARLARICVVTTSYPRFEGDPAGNFVAGHVEALRALGHEVEVIAAGEPNGSNRDRAADRAAARLDSGRVSITRIPSGLFYRGGAPDQLEAGSWRSALDGVRFTAQLAAAVSRMHCDQLIAHWLAPSAIATLPSRIPLLAIAHGGDVHLLRRLRLLAPTLYALRARGARLVFVSEQLRAIARAAAPGLASWIDRATVQPMGIDAERFRAIERRPTSRPTILIASRLVPVKGIDVAIEAMRYLRTPARLVIAGDGPERERLRSLASNVVAPATRGEIARRGAFASTLTFPAIRSIGGSGSVSTGASTARTTRSNEESMTVGSRAEIVVGDEGPLAEIVFCGEISANERDAWLSKASLVLVPSRVLANGRSEGTPMIALEALAAGIPVVASTVGGLPALRDAVVGSSIRLDPHLGSSIDSQLDPPSPSGFDSARSASMRLVSPDDPRALAAAIDAVLGSAIVLESSLDQMAHLSWSRIAATLR